MRSPVVLFIIHTLFFLADGAHFSQMSRRQGAVHRELHQKRSNDSEHLNITDNEPPPQFPHERQGLIGWIAFGDSFSAGPGAGALDDSPDAESCLRHAGAYPRQLTNDQDFKHWYRYPEFVFESCSGHITRQVKDIQLPKLQNLHRAGLVTLSIGGNDIEFSKMVKACIAGLPLTKCNDAINHGRELLYGQFIDNYATMMEVMIDRLHWCDGSAERTYDCETLIYQTSYPSFFESYTSQCDENSFLPPGIPGGPKVTRDLRKRLNQLTQELNTLIAYLIAIFNREQRMRLSPPTDRTYGDLIVFADQGERYTGHRFCREGVNDPDPYNEDTWFFNLDWSGGEDSVINNLFQKLDDQLVTPTGPASDYLAMNPQYCQNTDEMGQVLACGIKDSVANGNLSRDAAVPKYQPLRNGSSPNDTVSANEWLAKTFHPKIRGFTAVKDELEQRLGYVPPHTTGRGCPSLSGLPELTMLAIGDEITMGRGSGDFNENAGFLGSFFKNLLNIRTNFPDCRWNAFRFVGSQRFRNGIQAEAYPTTINGIKANMIRSENKWKSEKPNLIILTAGTNDIKSRTDPARVAEDLDGFIDWLFVNLPETTILVQHIPPIGPEPPAHGPLHQFQLTEWQKAAIQYNAAITTMADTKRAQRQQKGHKGLIYKVDAVSTLWDQVRAGYPDDQGYKLIADKLSERISDIKYNIQLVSAQVATAGNPSFSCVYRSFPDAAASMSGPCSTAAVDGWCVCNSQTYGIMSSGPSVCGYTAPPPTGTTTLCAETTSSTTSTASESPSASVTCSVVDKGFWDKFGISGSGWDGTCLRHALGKCGAVTEWRYNQPPVDGWEFTASGRLGIGAKSCIEREVRGCGAPSSLDCG